MNTTIKHLTEAQKEIYSNLIKEGYHELTAYSLALRDYVKSEKLIHYSLLHDMDLAVKYIHDALENKKNICVVADYDVDGATSCAIMTKGLRMISSNNELIHYFVPNRFIHGYGLQPSVIDDMLKKYPNTEIIVTVDNGIASVEGVEYAKAKNIEVLVTDHHLEGDYRPKNAVCIVNPNKKDCTFPSKSLAGCGVAFYFIKALFDFYKTNNKKIKANIAILMDYLAIGTIADVVPLDSNNQLLVKSGLKNIHQYKNSVGVQAILDTIGISNEKLNSMDIGFKIAPMLNAAGRIEDMGKGIDVLLSEDYDNACSKVLELIQINQERKNIEQNNKEVALEKLSEYINVNNDDMYCCVVHDSTFHEGVIGILASRVKDKYYLPTIMFADMHDTHNGKRLIKGSGRSIEGIHLRDAIDYVFKKNPNIIVKFGGHSMAAGLSIYYDKLNEFVFLLNEYCAEQFNYQKPNKTIEIDKVLDNISHIGLDEIKELNNQIWGQKFPAPIYMGKFKINEQKLRGNNTHLSLTLSQANHNPISAMWFFKDTLLDESKEYHIAFKFSINDFRGNESVQILIEDAQIVD